MTEASPNPWSKCASTGKDLLERALVLKTGVERVRWGCYRQGTGCGSRGEMRKETTERSRDRRGSRVLQVGDIPAVLYRCLSACKGSRYKGW